CAGTIGRLDDTPLVRLAEASALTGMGGAGKSALAFEVVRRARSKARQCVLLIVVDEDWDGPLQAHVAALLRVGNRQPTPSMIETLGVAGRLLVIVDSLSERGTGDAVERVGKATRENRKSSRGHENVRCWG
ncbi:MAG: hypothetical protein V3T69_06445, partial [Acidiferrobacterales bacterium]